MNIVKYLRTMICAACLLMIDGQMAMAQVTIGSITEPQPFSLLELISGGDKGLRLPQLSEDEKINAFGADNAVLRNTGQVAEGLQIFNTTTLCVETWNGSVWISECKPCDGITFPTVGSAYNFCSGSGATIADLTAKVTAKVGENVSWYDDPTDGTKYPPTTPLVSGTTYYAETGVGNCTSPDPRTAVKVTLGDCSVTPSSVGITTFTNVMYDFQYQTLEAYNSGGIATNYQWQVGKNISTMTNIEGAPNSAFFTIPTFFDKAYADAYNVYSDTLYFQCRLTNTAGTVLTPVLSMLFINTTEADSVTLLSGYDKDSNGVKYITLGKGSEGQTVAGGSTATLKMALLNLGQGTDTWNFDANSFTNSNAGDLGDFYQWGRVPDGHEHIVWRKGTDHVDSIRPMIGEDNNTSEVVSGQTSSNGTYSDWNNGIGDNFDQVLAGADVAGKFIAYGNGDWSTIDSHRWGSVSASSTSRNPAKTANDPCPAGWQVPSIWQYSDIYMGDGSGNPVPGAYSEATDNKWVWRGTVYNAVGGAVITNTTTKAMVFLPAAGYRRSDTGALSIVGSNGSYWSSTRNNVIYSEFMFFNSNDVYPCYYYVNYRASGFQIRCVADCVPAQPSAITFENGGFICDGSDDIVFSITDDEPGVTYKWEVTDHPEWVTIISGQGTNKIRVIVNTNGVTGDSGGAKENVYITVKVTPSNGCGNGTPRSLGGTMVSWCT